MSFDVHHWLNELTQRLKSVFGARLKAVGLQGSFARGEETPQSDIDAVVILDKLSAEDIFAYKAILKNMPQTTHPICGFFGGQEELKNWPHADLFQFSRDTQLIYGSLTGILPSLNRQDALLAAKTGAGNIYHALLHTWIHGELTPLFIQSLCKAAFFMLQAAHYTRTSCYISSKTDLIQATPFSDEKAILQNSLVAPTAEQITPLAGVLLHCCQRLLSSYTKRPIYK